MNRLEAMVVPHAAGLCDGCYEERAVERDGAGGAYCATCRELNRQLNARYQRKLLRLAEEEQALRREAEEHAERAARLFGSLPRVDGAMPEAKGGLLAWARKVWNAIF